MDKGACVQMFSVFLYYNCIIILLSVTVSVCHDKGNVFFTINSPVYVYRKQINNINKENALLYYLTFYIDTISH